MPKIIRGPSITLGEDTFPLPDVIGVISESIDEDVDDPDEVNQLLIRRYAEASPETRKLLDDYTADLCGWSLRTAILKADADEDLLKSLGIEQDAENTESAEDGG